VQLKQPLDVTIYYALSLRLIIKTTALYWIIITHLPYLAYIKITYKT